MYAIRSYYAIKRGTKGEFEITETINEDNAKITFNVGFTSLKEL